MAGIASFLIGTGDGGKPRSQEEKISRDARAVFKGFLSLCVAGLVFVTIAQWGARNTASAAVLWSMTCLAIGSLVGFLFGIPRVLQAEASAGPPPAGSTPSPNGQPAGASTYTLKVNTNLEQISDWLTKIFVGLGLVQLQRVPEHLNRASVFIASGLAPNSKYFAGGLILYFSVLGFLGFYLLTRLYIAGAFLRAEKSFGGVDPKDAQTLQGAPTTASGSQRELTNEVRQAAQRVASRSFDELSNPSDAAAWAKAQLSLQNYSQAIGGYDKLVSQSPDDIMLRLGYAAALFHTGEHEKANAQLVEAYKRITISTAKDVVEKVFAALTYQSLYVAPPDSFRSAIKYGEEYVRDARNLPSGRIWVNLASAYGQRMAWNRRNSFEAPDDESPSDTRSKALDAVRRAVALSPQWKDVLSELLQHNYPNKDPKENDLEVFENDNEFREVLGLPLVEAESAPLIPQSGQG